MHFLLLLPGGKDRANTEDTKPTFASFDRNAPRLTERRPHSAFQAILDELRKLGYEDQNLVVEFSHREEKAYDCLRSPISPPPFRCLVPGAIEFITRSTCGET